MLEAEIELLRAEIVELTKERDAYEKCADTMAAAHKVERDELSRLYENALKREYALHEAAQRALDLIENMAHFEHEDDPEKPFSEAIAALKAVL